MVEVKTSLFKKIGDSLSIHSTIPSPLPVAQSALREIAHVHTMKDSSTHVVLSPQDCKQVSGCYMHSFNAQLYMLTSFRHLRY